MNRDVGAAIQQCPLDFLGEQPVAADLRKRTIANLIALVSTSTSSTPSGAVNGLKVAATWRACQSARGLPRVAMRSFMMTI